MEERDINWNHRCFSDVYPYLMASEIDLSHLVFGLDKVLLLTLGIRSDGVSEILSYETSRAVIKKDSYINFLSGLHDRGIRTPLLWTGPDGSEFTESSMEVFRRADLQHCVRQKVFSSLRHVRETDKSLFQADLWEVFRQKELSGFLRGMISFRTQWKSQYLDITDSLEEHLTFLMTFFKFPTFVHPYVKSSSLLHALLRQIKAKMIEEADAVDQLDSWLPSLCIQQNRIMECHPIQVFCQISKELTLQMKEKYSTIFA